MEGKVKWFNRQKGFGFIAGDDGEEYFVHYSAVPQGVFLRENDTVSFDPADSDKGKQAQNVTLLQKGSEMPAEEKEEPKEEEPKEEEPKEEEPKEEEPKEEEPKEEEPKEEEPKEEEPKEESAE